MPCVEERTVGEQQKNSTFKPHLEGRTVGRQQKNQQQKRRKIVRKDNLFLLLGGCVMKYDKKNVIDIMIKAAKNYKEHLQDKVFLIVYRENRVTKTVKVGFRDMHFLHLTGICTKLSAKRFYEKCINQKLSADDFELDKGGKAQQKLMVLPFLHELLYNNCMIGDFINSGIYIRADYFVGNTKATLSVGFRFGKNVDFPVTLYKEDVRILSQPTNKVLAIFARNYDQEYYTKCIYLSKGQEIGKLPINADVKALIDVDEHYEK